MLNPNFLTIRNRENVEVRNIARRRSRIVGLPPPQQPPSGENGEYEPYNDWYFIDDHGKEFAVAAKAWNHSYLWYNSFCKRKGASPHASRARRKWRAPNKKYEYIQSMQKTLEDGFIKKRVELWTLICNYQAKYPGERNEITLRDAYPNFLMYSDGFTLEEETWIPVCIIRPTATAEESELTLVQRLSEIMPDGFDSEGFLEKAEILRGSAGLTVTYENSENVCFVLAGRVLTLSNCKKGTVYQEGEFVEIPFEMEDLTWYSSPECIVTMDGSIVLLMSGPMMKQFFTEAQWSLFKPLKQSKYLSNRMKEKRQKDRRQSLSINRKPSEINDSEQDNRLNRASGQFGLAREGCEETVRKSALKLAIKSKKATREVPIVINSRTSPPDIVELLEKLISGYRITSSMNGLSVMAWEITPLSVGEQMPDHLFAFILRGKLYSPELKLEREQGNLVGIEEFLYRCDCSNKRPGVHWEAVSTAYILHVDARKFSPDMMSESLKRMVEEDYHVAPRTPNRNMTLRI